MTNHIDIHAHWYPQQWVDLLEREGTGIGAKIAHNDKGCVTFAEQHRELIRQFGRFPQRNALLGRPSTAEEKTWLEQGAQPFG